MILARTGRWSRFAIAFVVPFALSLAVAFGTYDAPPVPRINVRWSESVLASQRETLAATYHLIEPTFEGGRTWSYAIIDSSTGNLRRLVQDPSVDDTHRVDRTAFRLSEPPPTPLSVLFWLLGLPTLIGFVVALLFTWIGLERVKSWGGSTVRGSAPRTRRPPWPFHALLIAAYPVLQLFGHNFEEVPLDDVISPLVVTIGTSVIVWALARLVFRSLSRSAIVSIITVPPLMFFGPIHGLVTDPNPFLDRPYIFAGLSVVLYLGLLARVRSLENAAIETLTKGLNAFAVTVVSVALFPVFTFYAWNHRPGGDPSMEIRSRFAIESWSCQVGYCPDIYYLVLDGYGGADALKAAYDVQNEPFLDALRAKGFLVARRSSANYPDTYRSLRSALNMDYAHAPQDGTPSFRIDINAAVLLLQRLGYEYVLVPSGLPGTSSSPLADVTTEVGTTQSELAALTLERSILGAVVQSSRQKTSQLLDAGVVESLDGALQWHRHIKDSFRVVGDIPAGDKSKFVFAHIVSPHPPYVFDRNGDLPSDSQMSDLSDVKTRNIWDSPKFAAQLSYLNRLVLELVERIQASAKNPPIIIIHGDHGTYRFGESDSRANPSDRLLAERMSIFFAVFAPPKIAGQFYDDITPVNLFRALFRGLFGASLSLLDDRNYWTYVNPPRDVSDVVRRPALGAGREPVGDDGSVPGRFDAFIER